MAKSGAVKIGADKPRAPRSHPTMVVFTFGARKNVELPFVVGVMADLTMKAPTAPVLPTPGADAETMRKYEKDKKSYETYQNTKKNFLEIDSGNLNARMAAMRPRVSFQVPNRLSPEAGDLKVDFEIPDMDGFKPDRVAREVKPLRELIEQRERLSNLLKDLDGPNQAEAEKVLNELLQKVEALTKQGQ